MVLVSVDEIEVDVYFLTAQSGEEAVIETDIFVSEGTKELFLQVISPFLAIYNPDNVVNVILTVQIRSRSVFQVWSNLSDPVVLVLPNSMGKYLISC